MTGNIQIAGRRRCGRCLDRRQRTTVVLPRAIVDAVIVVEKNLQSACSTRTQELHETFKTSEMKTKLKLDRLF